MTLPRKPPYELPALREGVKEIQAKIDKLYGMMTDATRAGIMPYIEKEKARKERFEGLVRQHEDYERALAEHERQDDEDSIRVKKAKPA